MVRLPPLVGVAPDPAAAALPPLSAAVQNLRSKRKQRPRRPPKSRQVWQQEVKRWLDGRDKAVDWGLNKRDEQEIVNWFNALDMDGSGTVEEGEVRALVDAMGAEVSAKKLSRIFASIGGQEGSERGPPRPGPLALTKAQFVKLMTLHGASLTGQNRREGGAAGLFDSNTRLLMLAYRRQRLLEDVRDPSKRRNFADETAFVNAYGVPLSAQPVMHRKPTVPVPPAAPFGGSRAPRPARLAPVEGSPRATPPLVPRSPIAAAPPPQSSVDVAIEAPPPPAAAGPSEGNGEAASRAPAACVPEWTSDTPAGLV